MYENFLAANTSAYSWYSLPQALESIARIGYKRVEIASMLGLVEHVSKAELNSRGVRKVVRLLADNGLEAVAFSGHVFLNEDYSVREFRPRMEFAREIGASVINTKAGSEERLSTFLRNMEALLPYAEDLDICIGLETHGDIVGHGNEAVEVVRQFGSSKVVLNYDFGNVLINSRGLVDPAEDFCNVWPFVGHLHLKDAVSQARRWQWSAIGQGEIGYDRVFNFLRGQTQEVPLTVDLPLGLELSKDALVQRIEEPIPLHQIEKIMADSLDYVKGY